METQQNAGLPAIPLTMEGAAVLHQMMRVRWDAWHALEAGRRSELVAEASLVLAELEVEGESASAAYSILGHKGDLMLVHFRRDLAELNAVELRLQRLGFFDYLTPATSYVSVVELGLYESSVKLYRQLLERGLAPHTEEWNQAVEEMLAVQKKAMAPRLFPAIPDRKYICFYPMDRKRGEHRNWYTQPIEDRQRMMHEHGLVGRRYADEVKQVISGSMGLDDWEWGVDLFADDALVFKRIIYEMRFDEASAVYGLFGTFYVGVRVKAGELGGILQ
jgi:chlorite dismutase